MAIRVDQCTDRGRAREHTVAHVREIVAPIHVEHIRAERTRDCYGIVRRAGIADDDGVGDRLNTGQTLREASGFVLTIITTFSDGTPETPPWLTSARTAAYDFEPNGNHARRNHANLVGGAAR